MVSFVSEIVPELHTIVVYQHKNNPSDLEWDAYVAQVAEALNLPPPHRCMVFSEGGHPSRAQQARLGKVLAGRPAVTAVISSASALRFVVSAMTFMNREIRTFSPHQFADALAHVGLTRAQQGTVEAVVARLRATVTGETQSEPPAGVQRVASR